MVEDNLEPLKVFCFKVGIPKGSYTHTHLLKMVWWREKNCHVMETIPSLHTRDGLPISYQEYAFNCTVHLINRIPLKNIQSKSPFELLNAKNLSYAYLKTFGCLCFPYIRPYSSTKLESHSIPRIFLGYLPNYKGYLCMGINSKRVYLSTPVMFHERSFPS